MMMEGSIGDFFCGALIPCPGLVIVGRVTKTKETFLNRQRRLLKFILFRVPFLGDVEEEGHPKSGRVLCCKIVSERCMKNGRKEGPIFLKFNYW